MDFILFASGRTETGNLLEQAMEGLHPGTRIEVCRTIGAFARRLRQPMWVPTIIVILTMKRGELKEVLALRNLLMERRIVLVLPDSSPESLAGGLTLRPRYFCDPERGFEDLLAVLAKMIGRNGGQC